MLLSVFFSLLSVISLTEAKLRVPGIIINDKTTDRRIPDIENDDIPDDEYHAKRALRVVRQANKHARVCEGGTAQMSCGGGMVIDVTSANYGRLTDYHVCPYPNPPGRNFNCRAGSSLGIVTGRCEGKTSCSVPATNSLFGDPCYGTYKYLEIQYRCVVSSVKKARVCEGSTASLSCSGGPPMKIVTANYGRLTGYHVCPYPNPPGRNFNCRAGSSLGIVSGRCEGKTSCSVPATNSLFGDPCYGTYKYLEIQYSCGVKCGSPGRPTNGEVSHSGASFNYNTRVTYSCHAGYTLSGSSSRSCQFNGQWTGSLPSCTIKNCGNPGGISNGRSEGNTFTYGAQVLYSCNSGYSIVGTRVQKCEANGRWSGTKPTCRRITCPPLAGIANGQVSLSDPGRGSGSSATYTCSVGYKISGVTTVTCGQDGAWSSTPPTCQVLTCQRPVAIDHGQISGLSSGSIPYGTTITYTCDNGYELDGASALTCTATAGDIIGRWNSGFPECRAKDCGDPGTPSNGQRVGDDFTFGQSTGFLCHPGHVLEGQETLTCLASGTWDNTKPKCNACGINHYKAGTNKQRTCSQCPPNTGIAAPAGVSVQQCLCDTGFQGPPGGPCQQITCPQLPDIANAVKSDCGSIYGSVCEYTCVSGHVTTAGDNSRTCQLDSSWSGQPVQCTACPKNSYKSGETSCSKCPANSYTSGPGSMLSDCTCAPGYQGQAGLPCQDINECLVNNGGCQHACLNHHGGYRCDCRANFIPLQTNTSQCVPKNSCPDLDPPANGGLVCLYDGETTNEKCQVKCNHGFEHPGRPNYYESCGPDSDYQWLTTVNNEPLPDCIKELFPGIQTELAVHYFVEGCDDIDSEAAENIKADFLGILKTRGICNFTKCEIMDLDVHCGEEVDLGDDDFGDFFGKRRRRSVDQMVLEIKFTLGSVATSVDEGNCTGSCHEDDEFCLNECVTEITQERSNAIMEASQKVIDTFGGNVESHTSGIGSSTSAKGGQSGNTRGMVAAPQMPLMLGGVPMIPSDVVRIGNLTETCDPGMGLRNDFCVACGAGSRSSNNECLPCPRGSYQPNVGSVMCLPCLTAILPGLSYCPSPDAVLSLIHQTAGDVIDAVSGRADV